MEASKVKIEVGKSSYQGEGREVGGTHYIKKPSRYPDLSLCEASDSFFFFLKLKA